jgi:hypothetical protein
MENSKKQTAVEWLVEKIKLKYDIDFYHIKNDINQAKEMEKQQIIDARVTAPLINTPFESDYKKESEQYYTENYGN